ncbi:MAG TPA: DUF3570 domain-containing protein [Polyangia bacterium]|nr:DUF3570 domain-containing protein [Polyangia bacterium]
MRLSVGLAAAGLTLATAGGLRGEEPAAHAPAYQIESMAARFTYFDQDGLGYQSAAGPVTGPGSERVTVSEPQSEVVAAVGDRMIERVAVGFDVVTAASPNHKLFGLPVGTPVDAISSASRINEAGEIDADTTYSWSPTTNLGFHADYHMEEPLESWGLGLLVNRSFADDNTVLSASLYQIVDWFDVYDLDGKHQGRGARSTTNGNFGITQLLTPTTIVLGGYGVTIQTGTLTNTWNTVPLSNATRGTEVVPDQRLRHAFSGWILQWLPWQGALKIGGRFYADSWGATAVTGDVTVSQRVGRLTIDVGGRYHRQSAVDFFGTVFPPDRLVLRTADSDLAALRAEALSAGLRWDQPIGHRGQVISFAVNGEHYVRTNDLHVDFLSCAVAWRR